MHRARHVPAVQASLHGAARKTKKPLILERINGFGIWLRGQDLNL
jgi:hypothetical protein